MNVSQGAALGILMLSLLVIALLRRSRTVSPMTMFGVFVGVAAGVCATALVSSLIA